MQGPSGPTGPAAPVNLVPLLINYQARITDSGGSPLDSPPNIQVKFRILDADGGSQVGTWSETHASVPVVNGIFNVIIGSVVDLPPNLFLGPPLDPDGRPLRFLEVMVDGETLSPSHRITSAPYAIIGGGPSGPTGPSGPSGP